jgi:hypothetical protein
MLSTLDHGLFPTFVIGSLPRPQWVRDLIEDRKAGRLSRRDADLLLDDAVPLAIRMQERAGLDYVSDGEWRRESYVKVFAEAVEGFKADLIPGGRLPVLNPRLSGRRFQAPSSTRHRHRRGGLPPGAHRGSYPRRYSVALHRRPPHVEP